MNSRRQDCADHRSTPRAANTWRRRATILRLLFVGTLQKGLPGRRSVEPGRLGGPGANAWQRRAPIIRILFVGARHAVPGADTWHRAAYARGAQCRGSELQLRHKKPREARTLAPLLLQQVVDWFYFGSTNQDTTRRRAAEAASESVGSGNSSDTR